MHKNKNSPSSFLKPKDKEVNTDECYVLGLQCVLQAT